MAQPNNQTPTPTIKEFSAQGFPMDFEFIVGTGDSKTVFKVHKMIVIPLSIVFTAMIQDGFKESLTGKCILPSVIPDVFEMLLKWAYRDDQFRFENLAVEEIEALLAVADKYNIRSLIQEFGSYFEALSKNPTRNSTSRETLLYVTCVEYDLHEEAKPWDEVIFNYWPADFFNIVDKISKFDSDYAFRLCRKKLESKWH